MVFLHVTTVGGLIPLGLWLPFFSKGEKPPKTTAISKSEFSLAIKQIMENVQERCQSRLCL